MKKVGLYFGSYNPVHIGHLSLAKHLIEKEIVDEVWFVVSPCNPLKNQSDLINQDHRLQMVNLAIEGCEGLKACDVEFFLPKPSYTINTLSVLSLKYSDIQFYLLMGSDNAINIGKWKNYREIVDNYPILIYPRSAYDCSKLLGEFPNFRLLETPYYKLSSTEVRHKIKMNEDVSYELVPSVYEYIKRNKLYR